ncbi:MAG: hypothetical protein OXC25_03055 [Thiotrichales bacterium]|nr:hypothetical protein [Thiotrichales bacterium]
MNDSLTTIRARIHDGAIKRVTRTFAATLGDVFTELLQNARRADAARVRVGVTGPGAGPCTVTVTDDGSGIIDPGVLLSIGESGWTDALTVREDAAGMGMLSLARRGGTVAARPRTFDGDPAPGWRVTLAPEHFLGEAEAEVRPDDTAPWPYGTRITFETTGVETADAVRTALAAAARHYPLPVVFEHRPQTPPEGEVLERRAFLDGAVHVERWRGVVFGVFRDRAHGLRLPDPDVNFHGATVAVRLPAVESVHGVRWTVAADVEDCPELEFVLPARKEAVETPFLAALRDAARRALYRAMAMDPDPRPAFEDRKRAHEADIDIAVPPAALQPWRAGLADLDDWREAPKRTPVGTDALLVVCDPEPPEAQALARAAARNALTERLFAPDRRLEGYAWYDRIARVEDFRTEVIIDGHPCALDALPRPAPTGAPEAPRPICPDALFLHLAVHPPEGPGHVLDLPTDLAFAGDAWAWVGDARPLVTADSTLTPWQLAEHLRAAFFSPSDDADADSWERQRADFDTEALHLATRLLVSDDEARRMSIADAVVRTLFWVIPRDRAVDIAVRDRKVTVTLGEVAEAVTS